MNKYTPGPWYIKEGTPAPYMQVYVKSLSGKQDLEIARVRPYVQVGEANARLIAAAPELLDALEEIRDLARTGTAPDSYGFLQAEWEHYKINRIAGMANDALAKVE